MEKVEAIKAKGDERKPVVYFGKHVGLPFDVVKDNHFPNYFARYDNGMLEQLTVSDVINIHLLIAVRNGNTI